jgi:hypothetical protein
VAQCFPLRKTPPGARSGSALASWSGAEHDLYCVRRCSVGIGLKVGSLTGSAGSPSSTPTKSQTASGCIY